MLSYLARVLANDEYSISTAPSGAEALKLLETEDFDVVLSDLMMQDVNGLKLLEEMRRRKMDTAVILITAYGSLRSAITAMRLGAVDYVLKPTDEDELRLRVKSACEKQLIRKDIRARTHELEAFVFAISHDLAGHLVALRGFANRLRKSCGGRIGREALEHLDRIDSSSELMEKLITSISDFAKVGRGTAKFEKIDLNRLVRDVIENLQSLIEEKGIDLRVAPGMPDIEGDWISTYELFHNLINNAVKFSRDDVKPFIEIGMFESEKYYKFYVKDNGVGVARADQERIFEMFGRGREGQQVPGTGMGLAIARKVVNSVGGNIWVESEENQGSTFYFTIPKQSARPAKAEVEEARSSRS